MRSPTRPPHSINGNSAEKPSPAPAPERPPERGNPPPRRPIDARPEAGKPNAPKPDPHAVRAAEAAAIGTVPSWLRPFTTTPTTRFTRTPDYLMPPRASDGEAPLAPKPAPVQPSAPVQQAAPVLPAVPTPPAPAPVAPTRQPAPQAEAAGPMQPQTIRKLAQLIQTEFTPPARPQTQDDRPVPLTRLQQHRADVAAAQAAAEATATATAVAAPEPIIPSILPIEAPLRASVSVSFVWPIAKQPAPAPIPEPELLQPVEAEAEDEPEDQAVVAVEAAAVPAAEPKPIVAKALIPRAPYDPDDYEYPPLDLLSEPPIVEPDFELSAEFLDKNSVTLQQTLRDFGVRGEIIDANPGPVVTLYELEPAPGTKSSRVIALSADIARSMSAVSARVAVVEGRNVIGIELPNQRRETVWLRELLDSPEFAAAHTKLGLCLGKTIGGEPVIADLARMPHLLVAGTTGSGKSVAINTMILSLLYQYRPEECRMIMIDPKMLELSVYDGIPHLLTPVVTDPRKAVVALKWAVREMEERYKKMSRLGVRNIDGFNQRVVEAASRGEVITRQIATGFDRDTGETIHEEEVMDLAPLPYIVVVVDEMADLMMVAGKDIEGAIQRLAQMARAAGIHLIMATQRPSVDVITGTIKANFPTRISFQVTSKIDSRTILGEMGAEQLLGQGDMLYMAGGGRITRVHGPFVSDHEVEQVVAHLKLQARPEYLESVTADEDDEGPAPAPAAAEDSAVFDKGSFGDDGSDAYDQAVAIVLRDKKASTSYIQRRLQIGYNRAASIMERMEQEGIVGPANHAGKREIFRESRDF